MHCRRADAVAQQSCHFCIAPYFSCVHAVRGLAKGLGWPREAKMKRSIALSASLLIGFLAGSTGTGSAVVYCRYAGYPANCVVRPGGVCSSHQAMSPASIPPSIDARPSGLIEAGLTSDRNNPEQPAIGLAQSTCSTGPILKSSAAAQSWLRES